MIEAHEMQDGRVEVVHANRIHRSFEAELVTLPIAKTFLNSSAG